MWRFGSSSLFQACLIIWSHRYIPSSILSILSCSLRRSRLVSSSGVIGTYHQVFSPFCPVRYVALGLSHHLESSVHTIKCFLHSVLFVTSFSVSPPIVMFLLHALSTVGLTSLVRSHLVFPRLAVFSVYIFLFTPHHITTPLEAFPCYHTTGGVSLLLHH